MTKNREHDGEEESDPAQVADLPKQTAEEVQVEYTREAPEGSKERKIHPRRRIPMVPEGRPEPDPDPSPPADIKPPGCQ